MSGILEKIKQLKFEPRRPRHQFVILTKIKIARLTHNCIWLWEKINLWFLTASLRLQAAHWTRWLRIWISHFQFWQKRRVYWHQRPIVCVAFARHSVCRSGEASGGEKQGNGRVTHTQTHTYKSGQGSMNVWQRHRNHFKMFEVFGIRAIFFVASHISISDKVLTPNHPNIGGFCIAMGLAWTKHKQDRESASFSAVNIDALIVHTST